MEQLTKGWQKIDGVNLFFNVTACTVIADEFLCLRLRLHVRMKGRNVSISSDILILEYRH